MQSESLQYPIGKYIKPALITRQVITNWIEEINLLPNKIKSAAAHLENYQLNTPYRPNGWTLRQLIHHIADSHINAYIRFKLALTEDNPTIKPYMEDKWAELPDYNLPIALPISMLVAIHEKWVYLLRKMDDEDYLKTYRHPDQQNISTLQEVLGLYAWHGNHHLAQLTNLCTRMQW